MTKNIMENMKFLVMIVLGMSLSFLVVFITTDLITQITLLILFTPWIVFIIRWVFDANVFARDVVYDFIAVLVSGTTIIMLLYFFVA